ncbi:hypothetical protein EC396_04515 [Lutibacter sp. HS1-25]|nr:hypothetical protein EC396_04515 [Lutibacter sp. HS1-25]
MAGLLFFSNFFLIFFSQIINNCIFVRVWYLKLPLRLVIDVICYEKDEAFKSKLFLTFITKNTNLL